MKSVVATGAVLAKKLLWPARSQGSADVGVGVGVLRVGVFTLHAELQPIANKMTTKNL